MESRNLYTYGILVILTCYLFSQEIRDIKVENEDMLAIKLHRLLIIDIFCVALRPRQKDNRLSVKRSKCQRGTRLFVFILYFCYFFTPNAELILYQ